MKPDFHIMRNKSLHARFLGTVLTVTVLVAVVVAIVVYVTTRSYFLDTGAESVRATAAAVEGSVAVGIYAMDEVLLNEVVGGLARHPSVLHVVVIDTNGKILASGSANTRSIGAESIFTAQTKLSFELALKSPFNANETVGYEQIWLNTDRLSAEAGRLAAFVVLALIFLMAAGLAVFNLLASRLLSRPMHRLAEKLEQIQIGSSYRVIVDQDHVSNEVGVVAASVNRLLDLQETALERERNLRTEIEALEARYRDIFDSTSAGIFILSSDGALLHANRALSRILGLSADGLKNAHAAKFPSSVFLRPSQLIHLIDQARKSEQPEAADLELIRQDGKTVWVHCMVSCLPESKSGDNRIEGVLYDVNQRKAIENAAHHRAEHDALTGLKSRSYIEAALSQEVNYARKDQSAVTLMFIDLDGFKAVNDRWGHAAGDAVLVEVARRLRKLFQRGCDVVGRLGGDELVVMIIGLEATHPSVADLASRLIDSFEEIFVLPSGETVQVGASVGLASYPLHATNAKTLIHAADAAMYAVKQSGKGGFVVAQTGIEGEDAGSIEWQEALNSLISTSNLQRDPLTRLMDRRQLVDQLTGEHARVAGGTGAVGVICLDIDQFKMINVARGEHIGDEVLCEVARRLGQILRRNDILARTGSDEFVVLVPADNVLDSDSRNLVEMVATKLLSSLAEPFGLSDGALNVRASVGASIIDCDTVQGLDSLREAQLALRRAKSEGGRALVFFQKDMMAGFHDRLALEEDLRAAIGTEQFFLHVQPQVDQAGVITGGEALLRWQHPKRGLVPPDQFIDLAESCGAIVELGSWVLQAGCNLLREMCELNDNLTLAINISPAQFSHPDFIHQVQSVLSTSLAPPNSLILEITEGLLITDIATVTGRLEELGKLGIRFSIDDFGTGFSSLSYLRQMPLYEIKIDRTFIAGLPDDIASAGIVGSILSMGTHLGLRVVAEGVETAAQSSFLIAQGCPTLQGWLHGRPMLPNKFFEALDAQIRPA